jgi:uncharacterized membrane protein YhaH (DUF805 family)
MMEWMLMPYHRYAEFSGRSRRQEYWMFALFNFLVVFALIALLFAGGLPAVDEYGNAVGEPGALFYLAIVAYVFFALVSFIPSLAVLVRRLHDLDKSGWWILINFIPFGGLVLLVMTFMDGTPGDNSYGPDPKARANAGFG